MCGVILYPMHFAAFVVMTIMIMITITIIQITKCGEKNNRSKT